MRKDLQIIIETLTVTPEQREYMSAQNENGPHYQLIEQLFHLCTFQGHHRLAIPLVHDETTAKSLLQHLLKNRAKIGVDWAITYKEFWDHTRTIGLVYDKSDRWFYKQTAA